MRISCCFLLFVVGNISCTSSTSNLREEKKNIEESYQSYNCLSDDYSKRQFISAKNEFLRIDSITNLSLNDIDLEWNLGSYPFLKRIGINNCNNPTSFNFLKNSNCLTRIALFNCKDVSSLNIPFQDLISIEEITIENCDNLPKEIFISQKLENLDLKFSNNKESEFIWDEVYKLKNLKQLNISFSENSDFVFDWIGLSNLQNLEILTLYNISIDTIPNQISNLKNLKNIDLQDCNIKYLSEGFGELSKLEVIEFRNNKIEKLPESFGALKSLKYAMLDYNLLSELPDSFSKLDNLNRIQLSNNKFELFPDELLKVKNIQGFTIHENKIDITPELINKCTKAFKGKNVEWYLEKPDYEKDI